MISKLDPTKANMSPSQIAQTPSRKRRETQSAATPKTDAFFASQAAVARKKLNIEIPAPPASFGGRSGDNSRNVSPSTSNASNSPLSDADAISIKIFLYRS